MNMYMHAKCLVTRHLQSVKQPPLCLKVGSTPSRQTLPAVAACGASSRSCGAHAAGNALTMARHQWAVVQHTLEHLPSFGLSSQTLLTVHITTSITTSSSSTKGSVPSTGHTNVPGTSSKSTPSLPCLSTCGPWPHPIACCHVLASYQPPFQPPRWLQPGWGQVQCLSQTARW